MSEMQMFVYLLLAFALQMARKCEGGKESEPIQECLQESDPMGVTYRGTVSQTKNGDECQRWDTDEPHTRHEMPDDLDNNYCRNPNPDENDSRLPWCYSSVPGLPRWEYCSIKTCTPCDALSYDGKCFFTATSASPDGIDYAGGVELCKSRGGQIANIYSQSHWNQLMAYIRDTSAGYSAMSFHLGLRFDPEKNKLTLRDGSDAPELQWVEGYPYESEADYTQIMLYVDKQHDETNSYLLNHDSTFPLLADVICEIN